MNRFLIILLFSIPFFGLNSLFSQTPGLIVKPPLGAGAAILDPDRDGYVSQKTNGVQLGFTKPPDNDVLQSELPYVPLIKPDPLADLLRGPTGSFSEIVGIDAAGNNAILAYNDGTNLLIRFRLGGYAPNSKSYSLLIDTDGKFGFTGINADPNAVSGNPGFEAEIVLETNFFVKAYNINGLTTGVEVASFLFDNNCQKSIAISTAGGDPDYFYDFYLPFSSITSLFTGSTLLRIVATTVMNPHAAMGNNSLSDVGGADTGMNTDAIFEQLIDAQTPTIPGAEVLDRSDCPTINAVNTASTAISGTSTEPSGTRIDVYVYASNGTTQLGTTFTTVASGTWSVTTPVALVAGYLVKATATAYGEGASFKNCDIETVTAVCASPPATPSITSNTKGICGTIISGATVNVYKNGVLLYSTATTIVGTLQITGTSFMYKPNGSFQNCSSGTNALPDGYYEISQTVAGCESAKVAYEQNCEGVSTIPVVTSPIYSGTVNISGTSGATASIELFINDVSSGTTTAAAGVWSFASKIVTAGQTVKVVANETGMCTAGVSDVVTVTILPAVVIVGTYCGTVTSVSGYSDATSGTVQIFVSPAVAQGSAVSIQSNGNWTCTGLSIAPGTIIYAKATISGGVTVNSSNLTTGTKTTSVTNITTSTVYEGDASITGTGTNGDVITLYVDGSAPYKTDGTSLYTATVSGGTWTISGIQPYEFYIGAAVTVTAKSGTNCESDASASKIVQCVLPTNPTYTAGNYGYCYNSAGSVGLTTSQAGVVYQLVNSSGVAVGPASIGTGSGITLYTNALTSDLMDVTVKVYKIGYSSCTVTSTDKINFTPVSASPTVTATSTSLSVQYGTTSVNLPYSAKSGTPLADRYTIDYSVAAANQGFIDVVTPTAISSESGNIVLTVPYDAVNSKPALGTYTGTLIVSASSGSSCSSSYNFTITVYGASSPPVISVHPTNATICSGTTTTLTVTASSATSLSYQWQSASTITGTYANVSGGSGATTASYTTPSLTSAAYYKVIVTNSSGSVTSNIATVTITPTPSASGAITGSATVCAGQSSVAYSVASISNATSYTWAYSGTNATVVGNTNSVLVNFASNATSGNLTVTGTNSCGSGSQALLAITVSPTPFINNMTASSCSGGAFTVTPVNSTNGIVPGGTTYSWSAPTVTGGLTGGATGSGASSISGTLTNPTTTTQTATYTVTPVTGSCTGATFTVTVSVNSPISPVATPAATICNSGSTGSISLSVSGGTPGYTYSWTGGATTQNISSLAPGTYTVTVTDSKGCSNTTSGTVTQTAAITITPSVTAVTCNGGTNGAITLTSVSGGNGGFTYLWNDGSSSMNRTGLASGSYTVTVTDSKGCTQSSSGLSVGQPAAMNISTDAQSNVGCYGGTNGAISITASGGTGGYTYLWSDGSTSEDRTGLAKGTYSVTVRDANSCSATASFTITEQSIIALSGTVTNATCYGTSTGSISVTASGGAGSYTYKKEGGSFGVDNTFSSLAAGTYTITVKDANLCEKSASYIVGQPSAAISATPTVTNVSCNGGTTGSVSLAVTGGTSPYTYSWSKSGGGFSASTKDISGLSAGTYSVTITDNKGCILVPADIVVGQPSTLTATINSKTDASCYGDANGAIDLLIGGGNSSFTYSWSNGASTQDLSGLRAGTYTVTVTDNKGCTATTSTTITQPDVLSGSPSVTATNCNGGSTGGRVDLTVNGGTAGFTYLWSNSATSQNLVNVAAGTYSVTITDSKGCVASSSATVTQPSAMVLSTVLAHPTCPPTATTNNSDGSVDLSVAGGTSPYTYLWSNSATSQDLSSLAAGTYTVTVTDNKLCTTTTGITLIATNPKPVTPGTIKK